MEYVSGFCDGTGYPHIMHDYVVLREGRGGIREVCTRCDHTLVTHKAFDGTINNKVYGEEHIRDFIQPYSRYYDKEYGEGASKNFGRI